MNQKGDTLMDTTQFLQDRIAERTRQGLRLVIREADGNESTLYPKDAATKARWVAGFVRGF